MKNSNRCLLALGVAGLFGLSNASATNPLITDQFTADPTARVFDGKIFVYPSHDIAASRHIGRGGWFNMEDYHVFSSENLNDWTDHGVIVDQTNAGWVNTGSYAMWAPDCVFKNGKYYFYFPAPAKAGIGGGGGRGRGGGGSRIGVAIADKPQGPFKTEAQPMQGVGGIDPGLLLDDDGSVYMYVAQGRISVVKLKENLLEVEAPPVVITNLPTRGTIEGPFPFKRNGIYYLTYPHEETHTERLEYAMSTSPIGPFKPAGVFMDEAPNGCWTVHQSIVEYKGQWYLFYHQNDLSPDFDKNRAIRAEYLYFNEDGTIKKVPRTLRGVGIADAKSKIQIDRYSAISDTNNVTVSFLDTNNVFGGWKISLNGKNTWVQFDRVDFGRSAPKSVIVRSISPTGGTVEIHLDKTDGPLLAKVALGKSSDWKNVSAKVAGTPAGVHNLVVTRNDDNLVDLDWVSFE